MALIFKGDLSFKLQSGSTGPAPDVVYGIYRRRETWQGKQDDLDAFLLSRPFNGQHPTWPWLRLAEIEPQYLEAGMVDVQLNYAGHPTGDTGETHSPSSSQRSIEQSGRILANALVAYRAWYASNTDFTIGIYSDSYVRADLAAPANRSALVYAPAITFRYGLGNMTKEPKYKTLALLLLANSAGSVLSNVINRNENWAVVGGSYSSLEAAALTSLGWLEGGDTSLVQSVRVPDFDRGAFQPEAAATTTEQVIMTNLSGNPVGKSSWYEYEETWELNTDAVLAATA